MGREFKMRGMGYCGGRCGVSYSESVRRER
jgi:hypothetical protein